MQRIARFARNLPAAAVRYLGRGMLLTPILLGFTLSKQYRNKEASFMEEESKFAKYFTAEALGFPIEDFAERLAEGKVDNDKDIIVFLEPYLYNEKFLQEVQMLLMTAKGNFSKLAVYYLSTDKLEPEQKARVKEWLGGKEIPPETLFLLRRNKQKTFDMLSFSKYFNNQMYLQGYFEKLKLLSEKNAEVFKKFLDERIQNDQLFIVGILDPQNEELRNEQMTKLKTLKLEYPSLNNDNYGIVGSEIDISHWAPNTKPGDIVVVQGKHYSKIFEEPKESSEQPSQNEEISKVDAYQEKGLSQVPKSFFKVIPQGISLKGEEFMESMAQVYQESNVFFTPEMLESLPAPYLVKMRVDVNKQSAKSMRAIYNRIRTIRDCIKDSPLGNKVLFVLEKMSMPGKEVEMIVQDVKRADFRMM